MTRIRFPTPVTIKSPGTQDSEFATESLPDHSVIARDKPEDEHQLSVIVALPSPSRSSPPDVEAVFGDQSQATEPQEDWSTYSKILAAWGCQLEEHKVIAGFAEEPRREEAEIAASPLLPPHDSNFNITPSGPRLDYPKKTLTTDTHLEQDGVMADSVEEASVKETGPYASSSSQPPLRSIVGSSQSDSLRLTPEMEHNSLALGEIPNSTASECTEVRNNTEVEDGPGASPGSDRTSRPSISRKGHLPISSKKMPRPSLHITPGSRPPSLEILTERALDRTSQAADQSSLPTIVKHISSSGQTTPDKLLHPTSRSISTLKKVKRTLLRRRAKRPQEIPNSSSISFSSMVNDESEDELSATIMNTPTSRMKKLYATTTPQIRSPRCTQSDGNCGRTFCVTCAGKTA